MKATELRLAAKLLRIASERFARHICNDFDLKVDGGIDNPADWIVLCEEAERRNGTLKEFDRTLPADAYRTYMPDWWAMSLLAEKLEEDAAQEPRHGQEDR